MNNRNPLVIGAAALLLLPILALAWWFASPLFINKTVDEPFPVVQVTAPTAGDMMAKDDDMMDSMAQEETMSDALDQDEMMAKDDDMMDSMEQEETMSDVLDQDEMMAKDDDMTAAMDKDEMMEKEDDMAAGADAPLLIKEGMFRDGSSSYRGSGRAAVYRLPDGSHVLRLEEFSVTNGPDLYVLLANHSDPATSDALHSQTTVELERLKGNRGSQNYLIPASVDLASLGSVIIYCKAFSVIFSVAPLNG